MNIAIRSIVVCTALILFIAGCEKRSANSASAVVASSSGATAAAVVDKWLGKWNGPEGTFLQLDGGNGTYEIIIQNLDGPRSFRGIAAGNQIEFERDGVKEFLHASNGMETGMKWLSDKSNCLTVRAGEGYCRD
ncbi:MAG TPA: hypothetical protein VIZ65_16085 [Cellvibrionaceae bacterium]